CRLAAAARTLGGTLVASGRGGWSGRAEARRQRGRAPVWRRAGAGTGYRASFCTDRPDGTGGDCPDRRRSLGAGAILTLPPLGFAESPSPSRGEGLNNEARAAARVSAPPRS